MITFPFVSVINNADATILLKCGSLCMRTSESWLYPSVENKRSRKTAATTRRSSTALKRLALMAKARKASNSERLYVDIEAVDNLHKKGSEATKN